MQQVVGEVKERKSVLIEKCEVDFSINPVLGEQ